MNRVAVLAMVAMLAASCTAQRNSPATSAHRPVASATNPPAGIASAESAGRPVVDTLLEATRTVTGEAIEYPSSAWPQVISQIVTIEPGQTTGWHRHGVPAFGYILSGQIEVEYAGIGRRVLGRGDRLVEAMRTPHNAVNLGPDSARILVVFMSAQGKPIVMKSDPPAMPSALARGRSADLVELPSIDPRIRLDLRYATVNNFTGRVVYPSAHAFLQRPAAQALARANERARAAGYGLMIFDAYRPWSVTRMFWDGFPMHRGYLADPLQGSRHNRGCAVDLTLFDLASGAEVAMPSGYDDFSERAHPAFPGGTEEERRARDLLRSFMEAEGFTVYENEWWHFDYRGWQDYPVLDLRFEDVRAADASIPPAAAR